MSTLNENEKNYAMRLREAVGRVNEIIDEKDNDIVIDIQVNPAGSTLRLEVQIFREL